MCAHKVYRAIGLMSGTSLDGFIDVALIETDGHGYVKPLRFYAHPYDSDVRDKVRACFGKTQRDDDIVEAERLVTDIHAQAIAAFDERADIIGFHGQTITHDPDNAFTWQIGDGKALSRASDMPVVSDMRQADIKAGGQGAPLLPLYHQAMMAGQDMPVMILNLGGVANMTYIGADGSLVAFDCGPANALMDDFTKERIGEDFDVNGKLASRGTVLDHVVKDFLSSDYFKKTPPKSLDRNEWSIECVRYASREDGLATLLEMSVQGIRRGLTHLPHHPKAIYVAGGGRKNTFFIHSIASALDIKTVAIDDLGWNGDATEAEGFAYLAVRSRLGLPLTMPSTTGVDEPTNGGVLNTP